MDWYGAPGGEYAPNTEGPDRQYPGSDPELVGNELFVEARGRHGDPAPDDAAASCRTGTWAPRSAAAHNEMMVSRWLENDEFGDRFRGTIRVNPDDIAGALREIDKYKDHPRVVQIGIPLQSRELYGKPQFWPLWEAAVDAGLPVAVHIEVGSGIGFPPTPSGNTRTYEQYVSFMALNYLYHLMNMIAEGVFERLPDAEVRLGRRRRGPADAVHLADGLFRPAAPRADAVGARRCRATTCPGHVLLRPGQPRRPRRHRIRRRMVRLHRQGRHGDVRLELSALAVQ